MADHRGGNRRVRRVQRAPSNDSDHDGSRGHGNNIVGFNKGKAIGVNPLELAEKQKKQNEFRKKYSDLIEHVKVSYRDKDGIEPDLEEVMADNIREGNKLFQRIGGGPGDMYMAFLHTKMCSGMILSKTEKIGNSSSGFSLDGFLSQLSKRATEEYGDNSPMSIVRWIGPDAAKGRFSLPALTVLLGAFDRESIQTPPEVKEKKPRTVNRRKFDQEEGGATYHEEVRMSEPERQEKEKNNPEIHAQEILRILTSKHKTKKAPENLYEFAMNKESIAHFFENLFYIAFLVKDGYVSIRRRKRAARDRKLLDSDLLIAQEESQPKKKHTEQDESSTRYQHILSFNSKVFRALAESSEGPPTIVQTKSMKSIRQK